MAMKSRKSQSRIVVLVLVIAFIIVLLVVIANIMRRVLG